MNLAAGAVTIFALGIGAWLFFHKNAPKITILLFLIGGLGLGGWLGRLLGQGLDVALGLVGSATGQLLGVAASTAVALVAVIMTLEVVWKGLWFKKAKPKRYHAALAVVLPTVIVAAGLPILNAAVDAFSGAVSGVGSSLG